MAGAMIGSHAKQECREYTYTGIEGTYRWNGAVYTLDRGTHSGVYTLCATDRFRPDQPTCITF